MAQQTPLERFIEGFIAAAIWTGQSPDDSPLDENYGPEDLSPATVKEIQHDCGSFLNDYREEIAGEWYKAGMDFLLTRNRSGAGFWDGDWPEGIGETLTHAAHVYGTFELYVGDDGKLYHHN